MKRMSDRSMDMNLWSSQRTRMAHEAEKLRSKSFGIEVLRTVSAVYRKSPDFIYSSTPGEERDPDMGRIYHVRCKIRLLVQDVKALERKLTTTHADEDDERRALEEDITGKILLACWRGIRSEIEQVVEKVIRLIVNDKRVERQEREERSKCLQEIGRVLEAATVEDYDHSHLRRILADAGAGISKYELLMASQVELHSN
ncbi:hypothetical protein SCLCIDRAFT_326016 [Scleroderma citrinum Foug A]|uniref:DNAJ-containing protein X-domain domain-containing protein n=1 Tax=Scleroderma citrinum Foug A TaxID=1036808 RepID=A0A0C3ANE1_9AGAM|nr:hypothetical protein SCLCIDRAFT_326016 [Scleroderma citrinum Foug A]